MNKHGRSVGKDPLKEQAAEKWNSRREEGDRLVEKWYKNDIGTKKLLDLYKNDAQKARNTAMALEIQERHLKSPRMSEEVVSSQFQTRPENLLKIVRIGVANSNRGNIFMEYPLQTTDDVLYFVDAVYQSTKRGVTANQKMYETASQYYAGAAYTENIGTGGGGTNYTGTIPNIPVMRNSIRLIVGNALVGSDDGNGNILSNLLDTGAANTIDYTTGDVVLNFLADPGAGVSIDVEFIWDAEREALYDQYGKMQISISKKRFNAYLHPLGYEYTSMVDVVLGTTLGISIEDELVRAVGDEHAKARDYKAIALARRVARQNPIATFNANAADAGEFSYESHAQRILPFIKDVGGDIFDELKRGQVNKAVVGSRVATYLTYHKQWKDDTSQPRVGVYKAGMLGDIEVYVCPHDNNILKKNEMITTFKNPQENMDLSLVFGVLTELTASLLYPNFHFEGNVGTVEDDLVINPKLIRLIEVKGAEFE